MTPEDQAEMERLVRLIGEERDSHKFTELLKQLNELLDKGDKDQDRHRDK